MRNEYFLAKWLNNEITEETLKKYISEDEIRSYKKIISATKTLETPDYNPQEALEKLKAKKATTKIKKLSILNQVYKVAAFIAVIFASYWFIAQRETTYKTQFAEKTLFELPDNSEVQLNAGSKIDFKKWNWEHNSTLNLQGEAYFKVAKGSKFTVKTSLGSVSVLGTKFNVAVRENYFEIVCFEGLVSVNYKGKAYKVKAGTSFKALGDIAEMNTVSTTKPSWIYNHSSFKSMPYKYVIKELERQYNIKVEYDSIYDENLFTGSFTHTNLNMALQTVSVPFNLDYTIINEHSVILK